MRRTLVSLTLTVTTFLSTFPVEAHTRHRKRGTSKYVKHHEDILDDLAHCEGGHKPNIVSRSGKYRGTFQFLPATWRSLSGRTGDPAAHDYESQKQAARELIQRSGWGQFPACSRKLGMR